MKVGIIGTGNIARVHAQALAELDGVTPHAVWNHRPEGARRFAAEFGLLPRDSLDELLADPALAAVTVCTPSGAHYEPARAALRAGKHVIVEKPLETSTAKIDALMALASERGLVLASVLNRRFTPAMDLFRRAVAGGRFGRLTSASCYVKWFRDQAYYDSADWRGTWELDGGGALINQAIHAIDSLLQLAGPASRVWATTTCLAHENIEVEDIGTALVEFENGARGVIEGATCCWSATGHPVRIQLCGTDGSVFLADEAFEVWNFREGDPATDEPAARLTAGSEAPGGLGANDPKAIGHLQHRLNFEDFFRAIRDGRDPATSAASSRPAVALIEAIYRSAREQGTAVRPL